MRPQSQCTAPSSASSLHLHAAVISFPDDDVNDADVINGDGNDDDDDDDDDGDDDNEDNDEEEEEQEEDA